MRACGAVSTHQATVVQVSCRTSYLTSRAIHVMLTQRSSPDHLLAQGLLNKLCRTKPAVGGTAVTGSDPGQLLKPVLFTAARETDKRAARAGCDAFLWLLRAAVAHNSPQVHGLESRLLPCCTKQ